MSEPESRAPAPGGLALVEAFVNSVELPDGVDELATPETTQAWLRSLGMEVGNVQEAHRRLLVETRERLRDVLEAHNGEDVDAGACSRLQALLAKAPLRPEIGPQGKTLVSDAPGALGFLGRISAAVSAASDDEWERLKVCRSDTCRWAFYDHSKNGRGAWCSMRTCGSREKARAYRERKRQSSTVSHS